MITGEDARGMALTVEAGIRAEQAVLGCPGVPPLPWKGPKTTVRSFCEGWLRTGGIEVRSS